MRNDETKKKIILFFYIRILFIQFPLQSAPLLFQKFKLIFAKTAINFK